LVDHKKSKLAYKPGSVLLWNTVRWPFICDARRQAPEATYPKTNADDVFSANRGVSLFGLAPSGVYPATGI